MILNLSGRTDLLAFYTPWLLHRLQEGMVRGGFTYIWDHSGRLYQRVVTGLYWKQPQHRPARKNCHCLPCRDIGACKCCPHGCRYCYANADDKAVQKNLCRHNSTSPFLLGKEEPYDVVHLLKPDHLAERQLRLSF